MSKLAATDCQKCISCHVERCAQVFSAHYLYKILQLCIDAASDGIHEDCFHSQHQDLKALDHCQHFNQTKLLITAVVVPRRLQATTMILTYIFTINHTDSYATTTNINFTFV